MRKKKRWIVLLLGLFATAGWWSGTVNSEKIIDTPVIESEFSAEESAVGSLPEPSVKVAKFVDGDTTYFIKDGQELKVRYLLIDTPELNKEQPFAEEAKVRVTELLTAAKVIQLEYDIGKQQDHYGRQLMYVWADDLLVQEQLAREGLCTVRYVEAPNTRYLDQVKAAEAEAKEAGRGLWGLPDPWAEVATSEELVYVTASGSKYHRKADCRGLRHAGELTEMTESEAQQQGYELCGYED